MTPADAGPPRVKRRFSRVADTVTLALWLDQNGRAVLERFWRIDARGATRGFTMPAPGEHGTPLLTEDGLMILTEDALPILISDHWRCLFAQVPSYAPRGIGWQATFSISRMPS